MMILELIVCKVFLSFRIDVIDIVFLFGGGNTASENGHKPEEENGNAVVDVETEVVVESTEMVIETTETTVDDQAADVEDGNVVVLPEEVSEVEPIVAEGEQKIEAEDSNAEGKEVEFPSSENVQLEGEEKTATEGAEQGDVASEQQNPDSGTKSISRRIEIPNNKVSLCRFSLYLNFFISYLVFDWSE